MPIFRLFHSIARLALIFASALPLPAVSDELILPASEIGGKKPVTVEYRLERAFAGPGALTVEWTDKTGAVIERRTMRVVVHKHSPIRFRLDPRRSAVMANTLTATFAGSGYQGRAETSFIITPPRPNWADYQLVIWQPQTAQGYKALETFGVDAAKLQVDRSLPDRIMTDELDPILAGGLRPYIENIATDYYSAYHRFTPDRPVNWRFTAVQALYRADPAAPGAFMRIPSLSDVTSQVRITDRLRTTVATFRRYSPLFYNLADEAGIGDLNAYWDFDFSTPSLASMRIWLRSRYGTLAALNREWATQFADWQSVVPASTDTAMRRADENYASWSDFKEWMDVAFARAVERGRDAIHAADPTALAGLEGVQKPRWGGYDYELLAHAVDVIEAGAEPQDLDLLRSLNPELRLLTTSSVSDSRAEHVVWRALLQGARGLVLWDENARLVTRDGTIGPGGQAAKSYLREIRDGIGALLINSRATSSPVAILYSPESLRVQWMLDWRDKGSAWASRTAEDEWRDDGAVRGEMNAYRRGLEQLGIEPRYVSSATLEQGALDDGTTRVVMLPHIIALSRREARSLSKFVERGGIIVADTRPGQFDSHGRKLSGTRLATLFGGAEGAAWRHGVEQIALPIPDNDGNDPAGRIPQPDLERLRSALHQAGVEPLFTVRHNDGEAVTDVAQRTWGNGKVAIVALQRDFVPTSAPAEMVKLTLPARSYVYDVRHKAFLGRMRDVEMSVDETAPVILAVSPLPLSGPIVSLPRMASPERPFRMTVRFSSNSPARLHVLHVDVTDPAGDRNAVSMGNIVVRGAAVEKEFWLPLSARTGSWRISVVDVASGERATASVIVANRAP